uniref:Uncharacterized protein n=1 Tax=Chelonoidis abingdonii TaxID=106734 RepID=A0A8C0ISJ6_CHEAB
FTSHIWMGFPWKPVNITLTSWYWIGLGTIETSNKNSGQRSYGIGGIYLQKKIQEITGRTTHGSGSSEKKESEDDRGKAEVENKHRKRMRSPFGRHRERSFSRERPAFTSKKEADHIQATEGNEKLKDIDSDALSTSSHGNSNTLVWFCPQLRPKRRKTI